MYSERTMKVSSAFILAKNEEKNLGRTLEKLAECSIPAIVLDSGSTDRTAQIAKRYGAELRAYQYINHYTSYNQLTLAASKTEVVLILDADMQVNVDLISEIEQMFSADEHLQVVVCPILMYWEGLPLKHASLCPPKAIAFQGGSEYFYEVGHGERLRADVVRQLTSGLIVHDDRKSLSHVLQNQTRYAMELLRRSHNAQLTFRDKLRVRLPLFLLITPLYSYIFKLGFLDGRAGLIYAIDRLIAEAIAFRTAISPLAQDELRDSESK